MADGIIIKKKAKDKVWCSEYKTPYNEKEIYIERENESKRVF